MACRRHGGGGWNRPWLIAAALTAVLTLASGHHHGAAAKGGHQQAATLSVKASPAAATAVAFAVAQDGDAYLWGGNGPQVNGGWDCSGLVTAAWARAGVSIARTADAEWHGLPHVSPHHLHPGDLLFYAGSDGTRANPGHVAMFIGGGRMVEAYSTTVGVRITSDLRRSELVGAARP